MKALHVAAAIATAAVIPVAATPAGATTDHPTTYQVTLINLTSGQFLSPPVVATHNPYGHLYRPWLPASDEIAAIAQDGDPAPLVEKLSGSSRVTDVVDVGQPLTRAGTTAGDFTDSVSFEITAHPGDRISAATMIACTNDGFAGLDAAKLPRHGSAAYVLNGYDAGRERNTEASEDLGDLCSDLGPVALPGDPDGNDDSDRDFPFWVTPHQGIAGGADLDPDLHGWSGPIAAMIVTPMS